MHAGRTAGWRVEEGLDPGLSLALFVRDLVGLAVPAPGGPVVPPLAPAVPVRAHHVDLAAVAHEWPQWWASALQQRPPGADLLPLGPSWDDMRDLPSVRGLAEMHHEDFWAWFGPVKAREARRALSGRSLPLTRLVEERQRTIGRPVRPFQLQIRVLPADVAVGWVQGEGQVVVTTGLRDDAVALQGLLGPALARLA